MYQQGRSTRPVTIFVLDQNPLIQIANLIDWEEIAAIVLPDLQNTTVKGFWFLGRRLYLRIHSKIEDFRNRLSPQGHKGAQKSLRLYFDNLTEMPHGRSIDIRRGFNCTRSKYCLSIGCHRMLH